MSNVRTRAAQTPCRLRAPQNAFCRQNGAKTNAVRVTMPSRRGIYASAACPQGARRLYYTAEGQPAALCYDQKAISPAT